MMGSEINGSFRVLNSSRGNEHNIDPDDALLRTCVAADLQTFRLPLMHVDHIVHPSSLIFLEPSTDADFSTAIQAYDSARKTLAHVLPAEVLEKVTRETLLEEVFRLTDEMQREHTHYPGRRRLRTALGTMETYMGVFDVLSQSYATYTALIWGTLRWILVFALKYVHLMQRIADMLEDLGYSLPRIRLYQQLLPTRRMTQLISDLYASVTEFLVQTICFFTKRRTRRLWSSFWGPFEQQHQSSMAKIRRLSACIDQDAQATAIAKQNAQNESLALQLAELSLVTRHTFQSVLQVKERQTLLLIQTIKSSILTADDFDFEYQSEMLSIYTSYVGSDWKLWWQEEIKHVDWYKPTGSTFSYVQTDQINHVIAVGLLAGKAQLDKTLPSVHLLWAPGMTQQKAFSCLILQLLTHHSDQLLYREAPDFYERKFVRAGNNSSLLFELYRQILSALLGSWCLVNVTADTVDASEFIKKLILHNQAQYSNRHRLLIYHINDPDPDLVTTPEIIFLDNAYDAGFDFDVCDGIFRLVLLELGVYNKGIQGVEQSLWSSLWRALRYAFMVYAYNELLNIIEQRFDLTLLPPSYQIKKTVIEFLQIVDLSIPTNCYERLSKLLSDLHHQHREYRSSPQSKTSGEISRTCPWIPDDVTNGQRLVVWAAIESELSQVTKTKLPVMLQRHFEAAPASFKAPMLDIKSLLSASRWDSEELMDVRDLVTECLCRSAEAGLRKMMPMYLESKIAHESGILVVREELGV